MHRFLGNSKIYATLLVLFALAIAVNGLTGGRTLLCHPGVTLASLATDSNNGAFAQVATKATPTMPPDPWEVATKATPTMPPDPWEVASKATPTMPPDPWEVASKATPTMPPDPWEVASKATPTMPPDPWEVA